MSKQLSVIDSTQRVSLETSKEDRAAVLLKSIASVVPLGGLFSEIISTVIPNQKADRLKEFVEILDYKISNAERKIEEAELKSAEFTDLFEDAVVQASRAMSRNRLENIASVLKNSLTDKELDHIGKKKILAILGELNDAEIIWLKSYTFRLRHINIEPYKTYYETHRSVLEPVPPRTFSRPEPRDITNKKALRDGFITNLERLGLIKDNFDRVKENDIPKFDDGTGKLKSKSTSATSLGRLLIDYLDISVPEEL